MKKRLVLFALLALALGGCQTAEEVETVPENVPVPGSELPENNVQLKTADPFVPDREETPAPTLSTEPAVGSLPAEETAPAETEEALTLAEGPAVLEERPTDEQVLTAYRAAQEACGWFAGTSDSGLMLDVNDSITLPATVGEGEWSFYRVTRPGLESLEALRAYLKELFSDEIVDELMKPANNLFADGPQGGLYAMGAGRGSTLNTGAITEMVLWPEEGDSLCTVRVTVELLWEDPAYPNGVRSYDFPYQKVGDKWVFTQFESII